jgi:hypothetical protein
MEEVGGELFTFDPLDIHLIVENNAGYTKVYLLSSFSFMTKKTKAEILAMCEEKLAL